MAKATSIAPVVLTVRSIREQTGWGADRIYEFASRAKDPLPLRQVDGTERGSVVLASEFEDWLVRNSELFGEGR